MTPEERIAQLEAEVRSLRLVNEAQAIALRAQAERLQQEGDAARTLLERKEAARVKKQRQRALKGMGVGDGRAHSPRDTGAIMSPGLSRDNDGTTPSSPSPFPSSFPPSPETSSPYPLSFPPSSSPPSASQGTASPSEEFELTSPTGTRRSRKQSKAEALFAKIQAMREARCVEVGEPVVQERWDAAKQNKTIGEVLRDTPERKALFDTAWGIYLADDGMRAKTPAWSLSYFMSSGVRAKYETLAAREEAA